MNKQQLVQAISQGLGVSQARARAALVAVLDAIGQGLVEDGEVALDGFGRFHRVDKPAQPARRIGARLVDIPARSIVAFHPSARWRSTFTALDAPQEG